MSSETGTTTQASKAISAQQACLNSAGVCREIASFCDVTELTNASNTCKAWQKAFDQEAIWEKRAMQLTIVVPADKTAQRAVKQEIARGKAARTEFEEGMILVLSQLTEQPFDLSVNSTASREQLSFTCGSGAQKLSIRRTNRFSGLFGSPLESCSFSLHDIDAPIFYYAPSFNGDLSRRIKELCYDAQDNGNGVNQAALTFSPAKFTYAEMEEMLNKLRKCEYTKAVLKLQPARSSVEEEANSDEINDIDFSLLQEFGKLARQLESGLGRYPEIDAQYFALCEKLYSKTHVTEKQSTDSKETKESKRSASSSTTTTSSSS